MHVQRLRRLLCRWLPIVDLVTVAAWFVWGMVPPSLIPAPPAAVELYLVPLGLLVLFAATTVGNVLSRGRAALPWVGLVVLTVPLAFHVLLLWVLATWSNF
jgi:hypothetical protein